MPDTCSVEIRHLGQMLKELSKVEQRYGAVVASGASGQASTAACSDATRR
jgi:hypothetical protein